MLKKILIGVGIVIGGFLLYIAVQSSDFRISRELAIKATPEALFPLVNSARQANRWMPWMDSDPKMLIQYYGPEEGPGSKTTWDSTGKMGTGGAVIVESVLNKSVKTQITYTKPMDMEQMAEFTLIPNGNATIVRWVVTGKNSFMGRFFCFFINMDKMVGAEFEKGLGKLKTLAEGAK